VMYYVPGPKARAEYRRSTPAPAGGPARATATLLGARQDEATAPSIPAADTAPATPSPTANEALRTQAHALVQHFSPALSRHARRDPQRPGSSRRRAT